MIEVDYSEHSLCDNCCVDYKKNKLDLYDIWINGECVVTLCDDCINKINEMIAYINKEEK